MVKPASFSFSQEIKGRGNKLQLDCFYIKESMGRVLKEFCYDYLCLGKREIRLMAKLKNWFVKHTLQSERHRRNFMYAYFLLVFQSSILALQKTVELTITTQMSLLVMKLT